MLFFLIGERNTVNRYFYLAIAVCLCFSELSAFIGEHKAFFVLADNYASVGHLAFQEGQIRLTRIAFSHPDAQSLYSNAYTLFTLT